MRTFTKYPEVCEAIREADNGFTIWCASDFLRIQAFRYAQFKRPDLRFAFRTVSVNNAPRLVISNPAAYLGPCHRSSGRLSIVD